MVTATLPQTHLISEAKQCCLENQRDSPGKSFGTIPWLMGVSPSDVCSLHCHSVPPSSDYGSHQDSTSPSFSKMLSKEGQTPRMRQPGQLCSLGSRGTTSCTFVPVEPLPLSEVHAATCYYTRPRFSCVGVPALGAQSKSHALPRHTQDAIFHCHLQHQHSTTH
jgi:hypothetical protein